jgi:hypothetical protein
VTAGSWEHLAGEARFRPRFAVVPGTEFAVVGRQDDRESWRELARVRVPAPNVAPLTIVDAIGPAVESVPANLLRFTVTFSSEMEEGSAAGRVQLLDEAGAIIPGALLDMPPELWDRERRRLTVLLEPGRIKRGLQPNVQAGAPLREGSTVTLAVDSGIRDSTGGRLVEVARRTYRVEAPIRARVDPTRWQVTWPDTATDSVIVRFDRPLDGALVQRHLRAVDVDGHPVAGQTRIDEAVRQWVFTPSVGVVGLELRVDSRLEDLAGNSVRRVFDRDLERAEDDGIDDAVVILRPVRR